MGATSQGQDTPGGMRYESLGVSITRETTHRAEGKNSTGANLIRSVRPHCLGK